VWKHAESGEWQPGELFADRVTLRTPPRPGSYRLQVIAAGKRSDVAQCEVLADSEADAKAREWLARAQEPDDVARYWQLQALQLSAAAREEAQRRSAAWARGLRERAEASVASGDLLGALRTLQQGKREMQRMAWVGGGVTGALRAEIDANAARRRELIARLGG
jgi:hypothetical protein